MVQQLAKHRYSATSASCTARWCLYLLPVVGLCWYVAQYSVNVPILDQIDLVPVLEKAATNRAGVWDFFSQHNEHRMLFPRLIFVGLALLSRWNTQVEMAFSIGLAVLSFWFLVQLTIVSPPYDRPLVHSVNIATSVIFFSLIQYENWLFGFQLAWFLINLCIIAVLYVLVVPKHQPWQRRLAIAYGLCTIASFSSAHGVLSWLCMLPCILLLVDCPRQRQQLLGITLLGFICTCLVYSIGYQTPQHPIFKTDLLFVLKQPFAAFHYLCVLLGSGWRSLGIPVGVVGIVLLVNFLGFNWIILWQPRFFRQFAPWLCLGWFTLMFGGITTVGRASFGVEQVLVSRYTTVSLLLSISLLQLWHGWLQDWLMQHPRRLLRRSYFYGLVLVGIVYVSSAGYSIQKAETKWYPRRAMGATCLELIHYLEETPRSNACLELLCPNCPERVRQVARSLETSGLRTFPTGLVFVERPSLSVGAIEQPSPSGSPVAVKPEILLKLSGWAALPGHGGWMQPRRPSLVLISVDDRQSFIANTPIHRSRLNLISGQAHHQPAGWELLMSVKLLSPGVHTLKAWIYDAPHQQVLKLAGDLVIHVDP